MSNIWMMKKLTSLLFALTFFSFGCASTKVIAPVESFTVLRSSHEVEICATDNTKKNIDFQKSGMPQCFKSSTSIGASGSVIKHFKSPDTGEDRSLVLTVAHWCKPSTLDMVPMGGPKEMVLGNYFEVKGHKIYDDYVIDNNRNQYKILKYISVDQSVDVCLLEVERMKVKAIPILQKNLEYGDKVINIATPWGFYNPPNPYLDEGIYLGECVNPTSCRIYREFNLSGIYAGKGSSGSPILVRRLGVWRVGGIIHTVRMAVAGGTYIPMGATAEQINKVINRDFRAYILGK